MGLSGKSGRERRRWPRTPHKAKAQVVLCPGGRGGTDVEILDYSKDGIGVLSNDALLLGEKYVVREPHVTTQGGSVIYTVVRAQRITDEQWSIGLQVSNSVKDPTEQLIEAHARNGRAAKLVLLLIGIIFIAAAWWFSGHKLGPFSPPPGAG